MIYYAIVTDLMYFPLTTSIFVLGIIFGILGLRFNLMMGIISTSLTGVLLYFLFNNRHIV